MLLQLTAAHCAKDWPLLKRAFELAAPPVTDVSEFSEQALLESLLKDQIQAWYSVEMINEQPNLYAVLLTTFVHDIHSDVTNLLIYSILGLQLIPPHEWALGIQTITKYAKSRGAHQILAYSNVGRIIEMAEQLGADVSQRLLRWPLVPMTTPQTVLAFAGDNGGGNHE